jgi:hypothetical protein
MKKIVIFALLAMGLWAAPYKIGQSVLPLALTDQFDKTYTMKEMPKTLIMAFEKGTGATVNEYLTAQDKGYLDAHKTVFIADISQMPNFITQAFALPKMRKYTHRVLLIRDEEQGLKFPAQEEKITVMKFQGNVLASVEFISTAVELKKAIEQ